MVNNIINVNIDRYSIKEDNEMKTNNDCNNINDDNDNGTNGKNVQMA